MIKRICGFQMPTPVESTKNTMYVKFFSDSSVEKQGFTATFQKGKSIRFVSNMI
ncbi:unnamed protein product [Protopolystoma xenopodis]|uniref:CUB domain-containing protein n=1 Tax=Protopolystoma xenopodis TaxID=117903 RepID=A0A448XMA7_9PLAT|nr:unnamed protein product [Protopolystoma xenopodis]